MLTWRQSVLFFLGTLVIPTLSGCVSGGSGQGSKSSGISQAQVSQSSKGVAVEGEHYDGPFDLPLELLFIDMAPYGVAVDHIVSTCMELEGVIYPTSTFDPNKKAPIAYTKLGYHALSEETALVYGYRDMADERVDRPDASDYQALSNQDSETYDAVYEKCTQDSTMDIPDFADSGNRILHLDMKSRELSSIDPAVVDVTAAWVSCMQTAGVVTDLAGVPPELVDTPEGFRIGIISFMDAKYRPGELSTMLAKPTDDEINIALRDVDCRTRIGYDQVYYGTLGQMQQKLIDENNADINEIIFSVSEINRLTETELARMASSDEFD